MQTRVVKVRGVAVVVSILWFEVQKEGVRDVAVQDVQGTQSVSNQCAGLCCKDGINCVGK